MLAFGVAQPGAGGLLPSTGFCADSPLLGLAWDARAQGFALFRSSPCACDPRESCAHCIWFHVLICSTESFLQVHVRISLTSAHFPLLLALRCRRADYEFAPSHPHSNTLLSLHTLLFPYSHTPSVMNTFGRQSLWVVVWLPPPDFYTFFATPSVAFSGVCTALPLCLLLTRPSRTFLPTYHRECLTHN